MFTRDIFTHLYFYVLHNCYFCVDAIVVPSNSLWSCYRFSLFIIKDNFPILFSTRLAYLNDYLKSEVIKLAIASNIV
jgi:hypothetical protein